MYKFTVDKNQPLTDTTNLLTLKNSSGQSFDFSPGQYAAVSFYSKFRPTTYRCFSITSSPNQNGFLQFGTRTSGRFTAAMTELSPGEQVNVTGPFGHFILDPDNNQNLYFIAGGIGITPFISMLRYISEYKLANKITLLYSVRNESDIPFKNELSKFENTNRNLSVIYFVSGANQQITSSRVVSGRINETVLQKFVNRNSTKSAFYVCGPTAFMSSISKMLDNIGIDKTNIYTESFSQGSRVNSNLGKNWPKKVYFIAAGLIIFASLFVMLSDLIKQMPKFKNNANNINNSSSSSSNSRQNSIDNSINSLQNQAPSSQPVNNNNTTQPAPANPTTSTSMVP